MNCFVEVTERDRFNDLDSATSRPVRELYLIIHSGVSDLSARVRIASGARMSRHERFGFFL